MGNIHSEDSKGRDIRGTAEAPWFVEPIGDWGEASWGPSASSWGGAETVALISFVWLPVIRPEGTAWSCNQRKFIPGIGKRFFAKRVARQWNRILKEMVIAQSPLEFNKFLDKALRCRFWCLGGPMWRQELDLMILLGAFLVRIFFDSMILF